MVAPTYKIPTVAAGRRNGETPICALMCTYLHIWMHIKSHNYHRVETHDNDAIITLKLAVTLFIIFAHETKMIVPSSICATLSHKFATPANEILGYVRKRAYIAVNFAMVESYRLIQFGTHSVPI